MEWLRMVPVLLVFAVVGVMAGALLSHLILRFIKKQERTFLNDLFGRFSHRRRSWPADVAIAAARAGVAAVTAEHVVAEEVVAEDNVAMGTVMEEVVEEIYDDELYFGRIELRITEPASFLQVLRLQNFLRGVDGLRLVSVGGSADGKSTIVVHAEDKLPLPSLLRQEPIINSVVKGEDSLQLVMEAA
jgi:hypothetical protein